MHDEPPHDVKEEAFVDGAIDCFAGVKVMDASTQGFLAVFACLESECGPLSLGPLLAASD